MSWRMRWRLWKFRRRQRALGKRLLRSVVVEWERDAALRMYECILALENGPMLAIAVVRDASEDEEAEILRQWRAREWRVTA